jgi:sulfite reductase alpha subunit-like flavoprotein
MDNIDPIEIHLLYGSQTGTAKFASEEIEREFLKYDYHINLSGLDDFDPSLFLTEKYFIFVVSTTGYGEPPSNMRKFWKYIMAKENSLDLTHINYTVFGLGDTSYERFNWVAKLLNNRMKRLGANLFHPIGLGDEQHDFGYEGEFDPWLVSVIKTLNKVYFNSKYLKFPRLKYIPRYKIEVLSNQLHDRLIKLNSFEEEINKLNLYDEKIIPGKITNSNLLTELERKVKSIEISTTQELIYKTGDIAVIFPSNDSQSVGKLEKMCNITPQAELNITINENLNKKVKRDFPENITVHELFRKWLNINGIPNRFFCQIASEYTDNPIHKEKLELFYSKTAV